MRLCANENLPEDCVIKLRGDGHDVLWIREAAPGSADIDVLARAYREERLLITFERLSKLCSNGVKLQAGSCHF